MRAQEVKDIREALGLALNRRVSQRDLGLALGLSEKNCDRAVREWETFGPSGPAAAALRLMALATDLDPDYVPPPGFREEMIRIVSAMIERKVPDLRLAQRG